MRKQFAAYKIVYTNLVKLEKLSDITLELLKLFSDNYLFDDPELAEWRINISYFTSCHTQLMRDMALHNLRRGAPVNQSDPNVTTGLDTTGQNVTIFGSEDYLENSSLDVVPLSSRPQSTPGSNDILASLSPSTMPVSAVDYAKLLLAYVESVSHRIRVIENGADSSSMTSSKSKNQNYGGQSKSSKAFASTADPQPEDDGQGGGHGDGHHQPPGQDDTQDVERQAFLNKAVLDPALRNTPMPFPVPSAAVLKKYKSIRCALPNCQELHPNGTCYYCKLYMGKAIGPRIELLKQHKLCWSCIRQHDGKCTVKITCLFCREAGRDFNHNAALCKHGRYRFPCSDTALASMAQNVMMSAEDFIITPSFPNQSEAVPEADTASTQPETQPETPAGSEVIFKDYSPEYFSETRRLLDILVNKIRQKRAEEKRNPSKIPENSTTLGPPVDGTSLLPAMQQSKVTDTQDTVEDQGTGLSDLANLEIPSYLKVEDLIRLYNYFVSSIPLRFNQQMKPSDVEVLYGRIGKFQYYLEQIESDKMHKMIYFSVDNFNYCILRPSNKYAKIYHEVRECQLSVHRYRTSMLQFGKISFRLYLDREQISNLEKFESLHIYTDKITGLSIVTLYCLYDTGASGVSLSEELLTALDPAKIRKINFEIQTANGSYKLSDNEYTLDILSKSGLYYPIVLQKLKGSLNMSHLDPKQAAILNFDFGSFQGEDNYFNRFCAKRKAYILIGQSVPQFRTNEVFDPRFLGFEKFPIISSRIRAHRACDLFLESALMSGDLGLDCGALGDEHFIIIPSELINTST